MSALTMKVELAVVLLVEMHTPLQEVANALRCVPYHLFHCSRVADVIAGNHGVFYVLLEVIDKQVSDGCDATLCLCRVSLLECCLTDERHFSFAAVCHFEGITHAGHAASYYKKFCLLYHFLSVVCA